MSREARIAATVQKTGEEMSVDSDEMEKMREDAMVAMRLSPLVVWRRRWCQGARMGGTRV